MNRARPAQRPRPGPILAALLLFLALGLGMAARSLPVSASDSVAAWRPMASGSTAELRAVWGTSSSDVFAAGASGTILHYDGIAWTAMASGTAETLNGIWGASSDNVFAVGTGGTILHYDGSSWASMASGTSSALNGIWGATSSDVFAVGDNGTILRYNGTAWAAMAASTSIHLSSVCGTSATDVYAAGVDRAAACPAVVGFPCPSQMSTILHFDGNGWQAMNGETNCGLMGIWAGSASDVVAVGHYCTAIPRYDGQQWARVPPPDGISPVFLDGVWGSSPSDVYAVGNGSNLYWDGQAWRLWTTGTHLHGVWGSPARDLFAVGDAGTILHSHPPGIESISAARGTQGRSASIAIAGTNLECTAAVAFGVGISVDSFVVDSSSQVTASITISEIAEPGPRDVSVNTEGGSASLRSAFTVIAAEPVPLVLDIGGAGRGESLTVTVTGIYLADAVSLDFGEGTMVEGFKVHGTTWITCDVSIAPEATPGKRDVSVTTRGGTGTLAGAFEVAGPAQGRSPWVWVAVACGVAALVAAPASFLVAARTRR